MSIRAHDRSVPFLRRRDGEGADSLADGMSDQPEPAPRVALSGLLTAARLDPAHLRRQRVVAMDRGHPAAAAFDLLRTKLLRAARRNAWLTIGLTAPDARSGTTVVAANLALSLSCQADCRTLLLDLNLRNPRLASVLGIAKGARFERFLRGEAEIGGSLLHHGGTLAIGAAGAPDPSAAELLQARATATRIAQIEPDLQPDIVLVDAPPVLQRDDFQATLGLFDAVLLLADARHTQMSDIDRCEREISEQTDIAGIIVNRCNLAH